MSVLISNDVFRQLLGEAQYEIIYYPERTIKAKVKNILKKLLKRSYYVKNPINWPNGLLAVGVMDLFESGMISKEDSDIVLLLATKWMDNGFKIRRVDDSVAGLAFVKKDIFAAKNLYEYLRTAPTDKDGSLLYNPGHNNNHVLADMIGQACPYLVMYGVTQNCPEAISLAARQITNYIKHGMDTRSGLPYHGYDLSVGYKIGILGWGRAVGWILMGEAYFLKYVDRAHPAYAEIEAAFISLVDKTLKFQHRDGLFCWQIQGVDGHIDTSATAMICNAIAMVAKDENDVKTYAPYGVEGDGRSGADGFGKVGNVGYKYRILGDECVEAASRGLEGILNNVRDGKIYGGLAECIAPGLHPQTYGAYPWVLGPALSLIARVGEIGK